MRWAGVPSIQAAVRAEHLARVEEGEFRQAHAAPSRPIHRAWSALFPGAGPARWKSYLFLTASTPPTPPLFCCNPLQSLTLLRSRGEILAPEQLVPRAEIVSFFGHVFASKSSDRVNIRLRKCLISFDSLMEIKALKVHRIRNLP